MIRIVVDSTCDLQDEILEKYNVDILPLKVLLGDTEYRDRIDIQVEEVYDEMRKGVMPKTSQISPADTYKLFNEHCEAGDDFIYLAFSSALSGTCQLATKIAEEVNQDYPERKIKVIDTKAGAAAISLIAAQGLKMAEKGFSFEEIVDELTDMAEHIQHIFVLDDLNWLVKGGRISKTQATIGTVLDLKPILQMNNGRMEVIKKARGRKKALHILTEMFEEKSVEFKEQVVAIAHADDLNTANELINVVNKKSETDIEFTVNKIGCVLGSHIGIGGVGILFLDKKPKNYIK